MAARVAAKVRVVGRGNDHRVDLLVHLVEHHAEVLEERLGGSPVLHVFRAVVAVHIAEGDEILLFASLLVGLSGDPAAGADEGDVQLAVGGLARLADGEGREDGAGGQRPASRWTRRFFVSWNQSSLVISYCFKDRN